MVPNGIVAPELDLDVGTLRPGPPVLVSSVPRRTRQSMGRDELLEPAVVPSLDRRPPPRCRRGPTGSGTVADPVGSSGSRSRGTLGIKYREHASPWRFSGKSGSNAGAVTGRITITGSARACSTIA